MADINKCPKCGAPLHENAQFCLHCMTSLDTKQTVKKEKAPRPKAARTAAVCIAVAVLAAVVTVSVLLINQKHKKETPSETVTRAVEVIPICTPEEFLERVPIASGRLGVDGLWNINSFKDIRINPGENSVEYSADLTFEPGILSVIFENGGEFVSAIVWDVTEENIDAAKRLLICITDSVCNNYFTDIENVLFNDKQYPSVDLGKPFEEYFTDFVNRTELYNKNINDGVQISTDFTGMIDDGENKLNIYFYQTARTEGDRTIYDLAVYVEQR